MLKKLKNSLLDFALAWRLLLIIPLPVIPDNPDRPAGRSVPYFPLIGLVLGLILSGGAYLLSFTPFPAGLKAALLLTLWVALTGLLHLDGLMDSCDGLLPPRDPARRLEIMHDSRVGAFGVISVILLLLIKWNALIAVLEQSPLLIISIPMLARWAMVGAMMRYPLARQEGIAFFFKQGLKRNHGILSTFFTVGLSILMVGGWGIILFLLTCLVTIILARFAQSRLLGLTGDVYGAICELVETLLLIAIL